MSISADQITPPLSGRDEELAAAAGLLAAIRRGRPALLELTGEAGIGKTALAGAVAAQARTSGGVRVLTARAAAFERDVPYGLWIELLDGAVETLPPTALDGLGAAHRRELARLLPALREGGGSVGAGDAGAAGAGAGGDGDASGAAARFRLHRAVAALLAALAARGPLVLVLDDLHWADAAGLELVLHLLRHPPDAGLLLLLAARPGAAADALAEAGRDLADRARIELRPLSEEAADALLAPVTDADRRARLLARAGGNPLFLLELARAGAAADGPLPRSLQAAIESTTRELSADARALLAGAALVGDPFEVALAARAGGLDAARSPISVDPAPSGGTRSAEIASAGGADAGSAGAIGSGAATARADAAVDELLRAGLVALDGGDLRCRFRHPLVRQAVRERIGVERRRAGHAALAAALRERGAAPRTLAPHVAASAAPGDAAAIDLLDAAAHDAQAVAPDAAARWLEVAERLLAAPAPGRAAGPADAAPGQADTPAAPAPADAAPGQADTPAAPAPAATPPTDRPADPDLADRRLSLRLRRSLALAASGAVEQAHAVLLAVDRDLPPGSPLAVATTTQLAQIERAIGRARDARARLSRALRAELATTPADVARLQVGLAFSAVQLHDRQAGATVTAALAAAEQAGSPLAIASARACASVVAGWEGDHLAAAEHVGHALAQLHELSDEELIEGLETVHLLGLMAIANERFAAADALLERGVTLARRSGQDWALAALLTFRGMSRWNLGDMAGSLATVEEGIAIARLIGAEATLGHALALDCTLRVRAGERDAGRRAGAEALRILARQQPDMLIATSRFNAKLFMALDDDPALALRAAAAAAETTDASWLCQLTEPLLSAALATGDHAAARDWADRATALAAHARLPLATAKAASAQALVLALVDGDLDAAEESARAGLAHAVAFASGPPAHDPRAAAGAAHTATAPLAHDPHQAAARAVLGRVLAAAGEREPATAELQTAAETFAAAGLQRAHDQTAREIRRLGGRVNGRVGREAGIEGLSELSAREREIARMIGAGTPNKRIALTLHLSEKTVANHLTSIYAKLGLRGRTELAALVAQAGALPV